MAVKEAVRERQEPQPWHAPAVIGVPPLESGDRLTRREFERRYNAMPHVKKAELIERRPTHCLYRTFDTA